MAKEDAYGHSWVRGVYAMLDELINACLRVKP